MDRKNVRTGAAFGGVGDGVALFLNQLKNELPPATLLTGTVAVKDRSKIILFTSD